MNYIIAADTDAGIKKDTNQDSLLIKKAIFKNNIVIFAVICDGMGGLEKGEAASKRLVDVCNNWFNNELPGLLNTSYSAENIKKELDTLIQQENININRYGERCGIKIGTTITIFLIIDNKYYLLHVGDCRLYEIVDDALTILTEDQTVVAEEVRNGVLTPEEARTDARRNILLQCIGASPAVNPQFRMGYIRDNSTYLLCSDGFRHVLTSEELYGYLQPDALTDKIQITARIRHLINTAKQRNELDNITAAIIKTE